jgi:hypothetical protein
MIDEKRSEIPQFIRRVMPKASEAELREATAAFDEYMAVVWEIFQRIKREKEDSDSPKLGVHDRVDDIQRSI